MIPPTSKTFLVNNLAAGTVYDLCVLAIYDDGITSLTATRVVGCIQFTTEQDYVRCHFMQSQFLGGTMIIIIGGIIVASVLVFIIILMIRYKVCNNGGHHKVAKVSNVYSQTNGAQGQGCSGGALAQSGSKQAVGHEESLQCCKVSSDGAAQTSDACCSQDSSTAATSTLPHAWTPGTSASLKLKRKPMPKPGSEPPPPSEGAAPSLEAQNTNRNNSTALQLAGRPPDWAKGGPVHKRAQAKPSKFLTLPADPSRAKRRYSLNGELMEYRCYISPAAPGGFWSKRSLSMNGMFVQADGSDVDSGKATFSSSEWILESTV
uniref:Uncharacterized protein n=2 Tax=Sphaerodactylus townsendi TaxID=933632 RepID=A0ACB8G7H2_9SAUR